jgi:hypothetical protein
MMARYKQKRENGSMTSNWAGGCLPKEAQALSLEGTGEERIKGCLSGIEGVRIDSGFRNQNSGVRSQNKTFWILNSGPECCFTSEGPTLKVFIIPAALCTGQPWNTMNRPEP